MNVFELRNRLITDYGHFLRGFMHIQDARIRDQVEAELHTGLLWPEPLIQLNPSFEPGAWIAVLVNDEVLHPECRQIFRKDKNPTDSMAPGKPLRLYYHQMEAVHTVRAGHNYVLTTGTGFGKSLVYIIPIVDHVLRHALPWRASDRRLPYERTGEQPERRAGKIFVQWLPIRAETPSPSRATLGRRRMRSSRLSPTPRTSC